MTAPFQIISWHTDFINKLHDLLPKLTGQDLSRAVVVFPHTRPGRYLVDAIRQHDQLPLLLPRIMTGQTLINRCRAAWDGETPRQASWLDRVAFLRDAIEQTTSQAGNYPLAELLLEEGRFFPWGVRLDSLLEECFTQMVENMDLAVAQDEVEPFAAAILNRLRLIRDNYLNTLNKHGYSTMGLDARQAALQTLRHPDLPDFLQDRTLILAGFVRLTAAEDILYKYLWRRGAIICLHTDPKILENSRHWSCQDHRDWLDKWGPQCLIHGETDPKPPQLRFFAGYDLHTQLEEMQSILQAKPPRPGETTSVVLPSSSLLMPVLHHLPPVDINISLGYPLGRSLLGRFLEILFRVCESRRQDGRIYWRPFMDLLSHPYLRMLSLPDADEASLRPLLQKLRQALRNGPKYSRPGELLEQVLAAEDAATSPAGQLLRQALSTLVPDLAELKTLGQAARQLGAAAGFLLEYGHLDKFPIEAECLVRLTQNMLPALEDNFLADAEMSLPTLLMILRQTMTDERVPFEADPLTGLQILGTLETRLLSFQRVFVLDLTADNLPGPPSQNPLLPDSLRGLLGLPDNRSRDRLSAHTFHRLLAGAAEVHLLWQEGMEVSGLLDSRKVRSPLVEEEIWKIEQAAQKRLLPGEFPLKNAEFPQISPDNPEHQSIPVTPSIAKRMESLLARPLSPSRLDVYLQCPVRFFHEQITRVLPPDEVLEEDDHLEVGRILHDVLREAYQPYLGRPLPAGSPSPQDLETIFKAKIDSGGLSEALPAESWFMLNQAGPAKLKRYAKLQPAGQTVLLLEHPLQANLQVNGITRAIYGKLDRVDQRAHGIVILDYKSGGPGSVKEGLWSDEDLWRDMAEWRPGLEDPLPRLRRCMSSLQLPAYIFLYHKATGLVPANAAWVPLGKGGAETFLFSPETSAETVQAIITERIPLLLAFVLNHMQKTAELIPAPGPRCQWCPYVEIC